MSRYVTILATVEIPDDDAFDRAFIRLAEESITKLVEDTGTTLAPCDFTIDLDTMTDALDAEYGTVGLLDMNPPISRPVELQCHCDASILDGHLSTCVLSNDD